MYCDHRSDVFAKLHFTDKLRDSFSGPGSHADWEEKAEWKPLSKYNAPYWDNSLQPPACLKLYETIWSYEFYSESSHSRKGFVTGFFETGSVC